MIQKLYLPLFLALSLAASDPLTEFSAGGQLVHVAQHAPTQTWIAQVNSYTLTGLADCPPGQWCTLDVSGFAPGASAVFIDVVLIITHGGAIEPCALHFYVRNFGDTTIDWGPAAQAFAAQPGDGTRHSYTTFVSVTEGKFDYKWTRSTAGEWPANCSYGLAVRVPAWVD